MICMGERQRLVAVICMGERSDLYGREAERSVAVIRLAICMGGSPAVICMGGWQ